MPELPEFSGRDRVGDILADVGYVVGDYVRPPGVAAAYETVRRRRRNRLVATGVLAAALVLGPAAGLALANGPDGRPRIADQPTPSPTASSPAPTASASPSAGPTGTPPDGRISLAQLTAAPLDIPPWPDGYHCGTGQVRLKAPADRPGARLREKVVGGLSHVDVDGDGGVETAVLLQCDWDGEHRRVVVLDRDASGKIAFFSQVVATNLSGGESEIRKISSIEPVAGGQLRIEVANFPTCCGYPQERSQRQQRTYGWDGQRFTQTAGPTGFARDPDVSDLTLTMTAANPVVLPRVNGGSWAGTLTLLIRNSGPTRVDLELDVRKESEPLSAGVLRRADCGAAPGTTGFDCRLGWLGKGATLEVKLDLRSTLPTGGSLEISIRALDRKTGEIRREETPGDNYQGPWVETQR